MAHTSKWLLPVCGKCTSQERCVKIYVKESILFLVVIVFSENPFCTTCYFDFLKLRIVPLILKITFKYVAFIFFNFKTQISFHILIDDSVTDFLNVSFFITSF